MKPLKPLLYVLSVLFLLIAQAGTAQATTESLNLQAGKTLIRTIDIAAGDRVSIKFLTIGGTPNTLHFWVLFANGTMTDYGEVNTLEIFFTPEVSGPFTMNFDNSNSSSPALVTLNFEVEHYYFGIPSLLFILVAITVLLAGIAAGYIIMGKYS